jgi:hypothetical protein
MPAARKEPMPEKQVYKIIFFQQGEVYEIFAKSVGQGNLFGFVEVEDIVFGERSQILVDPSEDRLKNEFKGVRRVYVPLHSVVRIDQVEKEGVGRITDRPKGEGTLTPFPSPIYQSPRKDSDKP